MKAQPGSGGWLRASALVVALTTWLSAAFCDDEGPIKVGVLHSQTGTTAVNEQVLAEAMHMLIRQQNARGGLLGRKLEPVAADPASDSDIYRAAAERMLSDDKVAAVFGGWTSSSRRSMLPVFERLNGLLFYPAQFEGQESSRNIFYTGSLPNQQMIPALRYLASKQGGSVKRWFLLGTEQVYSHTANTIVEAYLRNTGVADEDIMRRSIPLKGESWEVVVGEIRSFAASGKKTTVISTVGGDANLEFYQELARQGVDAASTPVMAFSIGERELARIEPKLLDGHMAAMSYFSSIGSPANLAFVRAWRDYTKKPDELTNDSMEAAMIGFRMWTQAVTQAGTIDVNAVRQAMYGQRLATPSGFEVVMHTNHMVSKPVMIAQINALGRFDLVWRSQSAIHADAWSKYLPATARLTADWSFPWVCGGCAEPAVRD